MANEDEMIKTLEQNVLARCISLFSYAFTLMTARVSNLEENCLFFWGTTMSEVNYFRACWAVSAYRNEQLIPENGWKRVTGKYLHEPVLSVSTRLVNVSQFRKWVRAGCPLGQTCFLGASTLNPERLNSFADASALYVRSGHHPRRLKEGLGLQFHRKYYLFGINSSPVVY